MNEPGSVEICVIDEKVKCLAQPFVLHAHITSYYQVQTQILVCGCAVLRLHFVHFFI